VGAPYITRDETRQVAALTERDLDRVARLLLPRRDNDQDIRRVGYTEIYIAPTAPPKGVEHRLRMGDDDHRRASRLDRERQNHLPILFRVAELKARREVQSFRRRARGALQNRLRTCVTEEERHGAREWVRSCYPEPDFDKLIADDLRGWGVWDRKKPPATQTLMLYRQELEIDHFAREVIDAVVLYVHREGVRIVLQ